MTEPEQITAAERIRLADIKHKWDRLKTPPAHMSDQAYTTAVALWAALNVDYLIALAERPR